MGRFMSLSIWNILWVSNGKLKFFFQDPHHKWSRASQSLYIVKGIKNECTKKIFWTFIFWLVDVVENEIQNPQFLDGDRCDLKQIKINGLDFSFDAHQKVNI